MITIPLTKNTTAIIDDEDADLCKFKWNRHNAGYAQRMIGKFPNPTLLLMHRVIAERISGRALSTSDKIDHANGNRRDNRRLNLRVCSHSQNLANRGKQTNNTSGYKGVFWSKNNKNWFAQIGFANRDIRIGTFDNPKDAARAYDEKARELFGGFAVTNFDAATG